MVSRRIMGICALRQPAGNSIFALFPEEHESLTFILYPLPFTRHPTLDTRPSLGHPAEGNFGSPLGLADLGSLHEGEYLQRLIGADGRNARAQEFRDLNQ